MSQPLFDLGEDREEKPKRIEKSGILHVRALEGTPSLRPEGEILVGLNLPSSPAGATRWIVGKGPFKRTGLEHCRLGARTCSARQAVRRRTHRQRGRSRMLDETRLRAAAQPVVRFQRHGSWRLNKPFQLERILDMRVCMGCMRRLRQADLLVKESLDMEAARDSLGLEGVCFRYYTCASCGYDHVFLEVFPLPGETRQDVDCRKALLAEAAQGMIAVRTTFLVVDQGA
jgi:hypothetical protein